VHLEGVFLGPSFTLYGTVREEILGVNAETQQKAGSEKKETFHVQNDFQIAAKDRNNNCHISSKGEKSLHLLKKSLSL